ncbi:MAG: hypothetical protein ABI353_08050 [Isosphaeraceae bacterium]
MRFEQFDRGDAGPTASSSGHAQAFPYCGGYMKNWMNPTILKAKVLPRWRIFVKWCGSETRAIEACTWGKGPLVEINSSMVGKANGRYRGGVFPETVFIHGKIANAYEQGDGWIIWEATVFHEMMHWARQKEGLKDDKVTLTPGNKDVGQEFEMDAYGHDISLKTPWRAGP